MDDSDKVKDSFAGAAWSMKETTQIKKKHFLIHPTGSVVTFSLRERNYLYPNGRNPVPDEIIPEWLAEYGTHLSGACHFLYCKNQIIFFLSIVKTPNGFADFPIHPTAIRIYWEAVKTVVPQCLKVF